MDFTNAKDKRMRLDFEYDPPTTLKNYQDILDELPTAHYFAPPDQYYSIKQINTIAIYTETNRSTDKIEITVYMNVDLGDNVNKQHSNLL